MIQPANTKKLNILMIIRLFQGQKYPLILSIFLEFDQLLA